MYTPRKQTWQEKQPFEDETHIQNMLIFHCHVSLLEDTSLIFIVFGSNTWLCWFFGMCTLLVMGTSQSIHSIWLSAIQNPYKHILQNKQHHKTLLLYINILDFYHRCWINPSLRITGPCQKDGVWMCISRDFFGSPKHLWLEIPWFF